MYKIVRQNGTEWEFDGCAMWELLNAALKSSPGHGECYPEMMVLVKEIMADMPITDY